MMKKTMIILVICTALSSVSYVFGWGVWGHNHINKGAVLALPKEMGMFFYNHTDFITEESTVPDLRKYTMNDKAEGCRHYIDLERYNYSSPANMPKTLNEAVKRYGKDTVDKYGILPWYIQEMMEKLTNAFKNKRKTEILLLAADLGHYIGDANMPLHTSINHNGQLTRQEGIHAFWEAQLPELFGKNYNLNTGEAHYIRNIEKATWDMIDSSHKLVDWLLYDEHKMRKDNPMDKQYVLGADGQPKKNKFGQPVHTYEYAHVYHELMNGMVEKQMRSALKLTADFWYTAWVNAGKPDLKDLDPDFITERNKAFYKEDMKAWQKGKVRGCASDKEF
jgi:hypothetical protein